MTGNLNIGLLIINSNDNSINSLGSDLKLQDSPFAKNIDIFDGQIVLSRSGNIEIQGNLKAKSLESDVLKVKRVEILEATYQESSDSAKPVVAGTSVGSGSILTGQKEVFVPNSLVTNHSKVFLTPTTSTGGQSLIVSEKRSGEGFRVAVDKEIEKGIKFDWWIIN